MKQDQELSIRNQLLKANNYALICIRGMDRLTDKLTKGVYIVPHMVDINQKGEYIMFCGIQKKPKHKQAHMVYADTQSHP